MAYVTISGDLSDHLDLQGGETYYLTTLCNLGAYNVTSTTASASNRVTIKTNGTSGFRINSTGTWNTSYIDFTSKNDDSLGKIIDGSSGSPSAGDQTVGYLIQIGTTDSSVTMNNFTVHYCTHATRTSCIGWTATSNTPWTLTNGRFSYVTIEETVAAATSILAASGGTSYSVGNISFTNIYIDSTCQINNSSGAYAIRITCLSTTTNYLDNITIKYSGIARAGLYLYQNNSSGSCYFNCKNIVIDCNTSTTYGCVLLHKHDGGWGYLTLENSFIRNTGEGDGIYILYQAGAQVVTIKNNCIEGCDGVGAYGISRSGTPTSFVHVYNDYYNNTNNCTDALHGTEITTNPSLGNLPAGHAIDTSLCNRPDGYAIGGFEKNGSDTFAALGIDPDVWTGTGKQYTAGDLVTMGPMYALSKFISNSKIDSRFIKMTDISGLEGDSTHALRVKAGSGILMDSTGIYLNKSVINEFKIVEHTITASDITSKAFSVTDPIADTDMVKLIVYGGPSQNFGADYTCVDTTKIGWTGLGLDGVIAEGDGVQVQYPI